MTRKIFFALQFSCTFLLASPAFFDQKILLLQKVLQIRNTHCITVYHCWKRSGALRITQFLNGNGIRAIFQKIGRNETYEFNNPQDPSGFGSVLDATCNEMESVLFQFNSKHEFSSHHKWYLLAPEGNAEYLKGLFEQFELRMDSDVLLLSSSSRTSSSSIEDLHRSRSNGKLISTTPPGEWSSFLRALNTARYKTRSDMTGVTLRVSTSPGELLQQSARRKALQKLSLASMFLLARIHDFNILFVPGQEGVAAADFQGEMMFVSEEVLTDYDLIAPAYPFRQCFVYKRAETTKNEYLAPFTPSVWHCVVSLAVLVSVVIKLVLHMEERSSEVEGEFSWTAAFLIMISVYSQQGTSIVPSYTAGRIIILCLLMISVHLYNSYVSTIVSSLMYPSVYKYDNPDELTREDFNLGFENDDLNPFAKYNSGFVFTNDSVRFENKRYRYYDVPEGLANVRKGQFAFHVEAPIHYPTISRSFSLSEVCELQELDAFPKLYATLVVPKRSQYAELFKITFRRVIERGILQREITSVLAEKPPCLEAVSIKQLSIKYVLPAFILFGFGVAASMVALLLELALFCALKKVKR